MKPISIFVGAATALSFSSASMAQEKSELPLWEIGGFGLAVSQQAYPGSDQQVNRGLALPFVIYRGQFLRADDGSVGLRALKTNNLELDIGFSGSFGSGADDIKARNGMPKLGSMIEFGPRLKWNLGEGPGNGRWSAQFPLRGVFDLSDGGASKGIAFEPELVFSRRSSNGWAYSSSVGAIFGNQKLNDTFYGVAAPFALPNRPAYTAESGLISWRLGVSASRSLAPDWRLFGFARLDSVAGAANENSPLVRQKNGASVGMGLSYTWLRSSEKARP
ncbi:MipA/OmpV family protein [Variovorax sp. PCZ-1]|uniref:MipA/OmpV family protein n=1 Tax=Variovorax sp. PCZ-1 TaxID=2835533 RepID=UPI001BD17E42|nr:MipA/OmpV family protein [Variovorax sp. PCZ-1]MBS7806928.1 MipA/OmpV family protein [Variovorax sp. PCZ-1]